MINDSHDLVDREVVIPSPGNKSILYTIGTAFDIIIAHEKRHVSHAMEILNALKKNKD